jgi:hypothetical protein
MCRFNLPQKTFVCNAKLLFYYKNIGGYMIVQNCLKLLRDLSNVEKQISKIEKQAIVEEVEIDYQNLLSSILKDIADK